MPVFNEEGIIAQVVTDFAEKVLVQFKESEFIIVNDCSTDGTVRVLRSLSKKYPRLRVVTQDRNQGHGPALVRAYREAKGDFIFHSDSDNQFCAEDFWLVWNKLCDRQADMVVGCRAKRNDPFARLVLTRFVRLCIFGLFGVWLIDSNSPFRMLTRRTLDEMLPFLSMHTLIPSIILSIGVPGQEVLWESVRHKPRLTGKSFIKSWKIFMICLPAVRELLAFRRQRLTLMRPRKLS